MKLVMGAVAVLCLVHAGPVAAKLIEATATMTADQVVPTADSPSGSNSTATGSATLSFDDVTGDYTFALEVDGIDVTEIAAAKAGGLHVHNAAAGANGPLWVNLAADRDGLEAERDAFSLTAAGNVATPTRSVAAFSNALGDGELYVALHTEAFVDGELRGQLSQVPLPGAVALLGTGLAVLGAMGARRR